MTPKEQVEKWIEDGKDFNSGLQLLSEIGKNKNMVRNMTGRPYAYANKLESELRKYGGVWKEKQLKIVDTEKLPDPDAFSTEIEKATAAAAEKLAAETGAPGEETTAGENPVETGAPGEETTVGKSQEETETPAGEIPAGETQEIKDQFTKSMIQVAEGISDLINENIRVKDSKTEEIINYPPEIEKVKSEYSRLYNLRAQLHGQLTDVTADNSPANIKKRKTLGDSISEISLKLELLYAAKEAYFESGTMPDMEALFGDPAKVTNEPVELPNDAKKLKAMKKALQVSIHKAKCKLEYQEETKQKRANPMPTGPKRLDLEKTIEEKTAEIERIEYKLVELAH